ncbi:MAG TPA: glutaminyl-peptide cyclotransferase [Pyrinomonadaceae bacterium]|jgi:glutamine cyclotransferase
MKNLLLVKTSLALACLLLGCGSGDGSSAARAPVAGSGGGRQGTPRRPTTEKPAAYTYEIKNVYPHDRGAFTQGLIYKDGILWESTGQYGESSLRKVELKTGKLLKFIPVAREFFAEGMTVFHDKVFQLTWQNNKGFIYAPADFAKTGEFKYAGEGWGLTHDSESLIMSDGTSQIRFLDPETFAVRRTVAVTEEGRPVAELNELEYVKGEIYANVWQTDRIVRIDPKTGNVTGTVDLAGLLPEADRGPDTDVLNGIAYDEAGDRLFVTGKLWPKLFEIRLIRK